tara:strand:+ start:6025 stop:7701 length:1677 start_codon:yes stop_codon:yes gene_type:complete
MSNYLFDNINTNSRTSIKSQSESSGLLIPQVAYLGEFEDIQNSLRSKTRNIISSKILKENLYSDRSYIQRRRIDVRRSDPANITGFFDLNDIYKGLAKYKNLNSTIINDILAEKSLIDVGLALTVSPYKKRLSFLNSNSLNSIFNLTNPKFDLVIFSNTDQKKYVASIKNMHLSLKQTFEISQPQEQRDKENANIQILDSKFFLKKKDDTVGFLLSSDNFNDREDLQIEYNDEEYGIFKLKYPTNVRFESNIDVINIDDIVNELFQNNSLPFKLLNGRRITQSGNHTFAVLNDIFSRKYINMLFYITYIEILQKDTYFGNTNSNFFISAVLLGMILYGIRYNNFMFTDNKILFPTRLLEDINILEDILNPSLSNSSMKLGNSFKYGFKINNSSIIAIRLIKKIYDMDFVKNNLSLICKSLTFIKKINNDNISFVDNEINFNSVGLFEANSYINYLIEEPEEVDDELESYRESIPRFLESGGGLSQFFHVNSIEEEISALEDLLEDRENNEDRNNVIQEKIQELRRLNEQLKEAIEDTDIENILRLDRELTRIDNQYRL